MAQSKRPLSFFFSIAVADIEASLMKPPCVDQSQRQRKIDFSPWRHSGQVTRYGSLYGHLGGQTDDLVGKSWIEK